MKFARWLFFGTLTIGLMTEMQPPVADSLAQIGWYLHQDLKHVSPINIAFTLIELCLIACVLCWFARGQLARRHYPFIQGRLNAPIIAFGAAITLGVLWAMRQPGDNLVYALFEVRDFGILICVYFLIGMLVRDERDLSTLVWCVLIACMVLALENIYRFFFILTPATMSDLSYDHNDSLILAFGVVLSAALLAFGGTRRQRRFACLLIPITIVCMGVMQRRAAFAILPIGLIGLAIIFYRLRPKQFWRVVPALTLVLGLYTAAFWNNQGVFGQPVRAFRSQISPDPRDAASNLYRVIEHLDIVMNIQSSPVMGLGFGQKYTFYYPLPDLSFWQFWHYTSHNAVIWVWMDGGVPAFFTFFWLLGSGAYQGAQEIAVRREAWSLSRLRLRRRRRRSRDAKASTRTRATHETTPDPPVTAPWDTAAHRRPHGRSESKTTPTSGSAIALIAAGVCLIGMQVAFSYVDLGLSADRTMLLLGTLLGVMGRTYVSASTRQRRKLGVRSVPSSDQDTQPASTDETTAPDPVPAGMRAATALLSSIRPVSDEERARSIRMSRAAWSEDRTHGAHRPDMRGPNGHQRANVAVRDAEDATPPVE